jgi:hypothetical protein
MDEIWQVLRDNWVWWAPPLVFFGVVAVGVTLWIGGDVPGPDYAVF